MPCSMWRIGRDGRVEGNSVSDTVEKRSVTSELARRLIEQATAKAEDMSLPSSIAIVDESGLLKAFSRMDNAGMLGIQVAQDKAYTAAGLGMTTQAWFDFISTEPSLAAGAAAGIDRNIIFWGGVPIVVDGQVVGGLGVVGGTPSQDMEVAEAALSAVGLTK
jgi:uncharacterized protein GlcG (DUF336 family)